MRKRLGLFLLLAGLAIALYGFSEWHSGKTAAQDLTKEEVVDFSKIEKEAAQELPSIPAAPEPILTSDVERELGEEAGTLVIPKIGQKYSVYWGADDSTLKKGVGMYVSDATTVPGGNGHTVLSGHRDTVFTQLGELKKNDTLIVEYENEKYVYEIADMWITDKDDRTVIVPKDEPTLTLTTCYPFDFFGKAPDRYIVQAKLVSSQS
jgi:sortase A